MTAPSIREPAPNVRDTTEIGRYLRWLDHQHNLPFNTSKSCITGQQPAYRIA